MIPLRIVVRTNTPWGSMTMADFVRQRSPRKPQEFIRAGESELPRWEAATGQSFFQYRERVKQLCEGKLRQLGIPLTIGAENVDWGSEDEALIPIDDDDILLPSVTSVASRFTAETNLVIWQRITNYLGQERLENPNFGGQLDTCNWAIRKNFLAQFGESDRVSILARHWHAAGILSPRLGGKPRPTDLLDRAKRMCVANCRGVQLSHPSIVILNEKHSIYYLHSASISFLCHKKIEDCDLSRLPLHPLLEAQCT